MQDLRGKTLLSIGAGSMAEAIIRGLVLRKAMEPRKIFVTNRKNKDRLHELRGRYGVSILPSLRGERGTSLLKTAEIILIACKPHDVPEVLSSLRGRPGRGFILSVAAGVSTSWIRSILGEGREIVRAMPNTACAVLEAATAVSFAPDCSEPTRMLARRILSVLGSVVEVEEDRMDVVTGLSGSGPAYFYYLVEALEEAAQALGLDAETARTLAVQTLFGAGKMLKETGLDAKTLRRQVTSPNGTTMAGLRVLEEHDLKRAVMAAVTRASQRSRELGENIKNPPRR